MAKFNWGVLGAGNIAVRFTNDLKNLPDAQLLGVGSRSLDKAEAFARRQGATRAYGSYEELLRDRDIDAVYVATPHNFHRGHVLLALEHGKAVLCEKPMEANAARVQEMVDAAKRQKCFLMEAMWTRFLPVIAGARQWINEGRIGDIRLVSANFGFRTAWNPEGRLLNLNLAGGATLDVGVYVVSLAHMLLGVPSSIQARAHIGETGVDELTTMMLGYPSGATALLSCAVRANISDGARIYGTEGYIDLPSFWHATTATLQIAGEAPETLSGEAGYHFEAAEVADCVRTGLTESPLMPLEETVAIARTLEEVRHQIGLRYPFE
ncbi:MAG: Gfo/Idh/MocA family protein [Anaerolineae bacterium]|jgi:dihydrodiol dehydrogenase / D-xylose 1-dehydrogenase (NADP)|nr:Gfo/Idh/MocA family oxidoreductase [Chloroflexota bacterium]